MFFRLTHFHASLVVLDIILRPDCAAMFVQDGAVNSFWPEGNIKLSLQRLIFQTSMLLAKVKMLALLLMQHHKF